MKTPNKTLYRVYENTKNGKLYMIRVGLWTFYQDAAGKFSEQQTKNLFDAYPERYLHMEAADK